MDVVVTGISPSRGSRLGGTTVTITGRNFLASLPGASDHVLTVTIGGVPATSVRATSDGTLTATTGAHAEGTVDVVVTNVGTATLRSGFTYELVRLVLKGSVIDRISGSPISGSTIEFRGSPPLAATVSNGFFSLEGAEAGASYEVSITGPGHVEHITRTLQAVPDRNLRFSVLAWGASRFGITLDQRFLDFFREIAHGRGPDGRGDPALSKWLTPPQGIYVTEGVLSERGRAKFVPLLQSVNQIEVPKMFGGTSGPLPVVWGPALPDNRRDGWIAITFYDGGGLGGGACGGRYCEDGLVSGSVWLPRSYYDADEIEKQLCCDPARYVLSHEVFHAAYASHADASSRYCPPCVPPTCVVVPRSIGAFLQGSAPQSHHPRERTCSGVIQGTGSAGHVVAVEEFASWLVYHSDTMNRAEWPDINPRYRDDPRP